MAEKTYLEKAQNAADAINFNRANACAAVAQVEALTAIAAELRGLRILLEASTGYTLDNPPAHPHYPTSGQGVDHG